MSATAISGSLNPFWHLMPAAPVPSLFKLTDQPVFPGLPALAGGTP